LNKQFVLNILPITVLPLIVCSPD